MISGKPMAGPRLKLKISMMFWDIIAGMGSVWLIQISSVRGRSVIFDFSVPKIKVSVERPRLLKRMSAELSPG